MSNSRMHDFFQTIDDREISLCLLFNRYNRRLVIHKFFAVISRLGDGVFWYVLMLALPLVYGKQGILASLHMLIVSLICLMIYRWLKPKAMRQRPYLQHSDLQLGAMPLDYYSFPSGHTLHAVAFTVIALHYFPAFAWLLLPFASLIALSRLILGLHYPTDVLIGGAIGGLVAYASVIVIA